MKGDRITIPVAEIEFIEGGDTMWIHTAHGTTALRIKLLGSTFESRGCTDADSDSHLDITGFNGGPAVICLGRDHTRR